jgi:L-aspartate oxidase
MLYSLKSLMWRQVGLVREASGIDEARHRIALWSHYLARSRPSDRRAHELQNMLLASALITVSAGARTESRGTHFRSDHPQRDDSNWCRQIVLRRGDDGSVTVAPTALLLPTDASPETP